jgi:hypothetical protein
LQPNKNARKRWIQFIKRGEMGGFNVVGESEETSHVTGE